MPLHFLVPCIRVRFLPQGNGVCDCAGHHVAYGPHDHPSMSVPMGIASDGPTLVYGMAGGTVLL